MRYRRLPTKFKDQVYEYYYHKYHGQLFDEEKILNELSHPLKEVGTFIILLDYIQSIHYLLIAYCDAQLPELGQDSTFLSRCE